MQRDAWGMSLFADDLRLEVSGKVSIIGMYRGEMIFPNDPPFGLLKLVVLVSYAHLIAALTHDLILRIYFPGIEAPVVEHTFLKSELEKMVVVRTPLDEPDSERVVTLQAPFTFSPVEFPHEGDIKVRMFHNESVTRLGRMRVRKVRPDEQIQF